MNGKDWKLYRELVDERENCFGWFRTPSPPPVERTAEMIELVNRVLTETEQHKREEGDSHGNSSVDSADERGNSPNGTG